MKIKFIIVLVLFSIGSVTAQMKKWTLQECVEYAYENNLSIEQFELDLESIKLDKSDAIGGFLPSLSASSTLSGNTGLSFDPTNNQPVTTTIVTASGGLSSSAVLFDGLRNIHRLNRAKLAALASQYRLEDLKDDIGLAVANGYLQILLNKESLVVFKAQYAVTEQDLQRTKELVDSGVVPKGDLLEVEATAATQEQQIVNAENLVFIS
ncbi:MAG: TolC family protein, partial [Flavobacteriales bacterium]